MSDGGRVVLVRNGECVCRWKGRKKWAGAPLGLGGGTLRVSELTTGKSEGQRNESTGRLARRAEERAPSASQDGGVPRTGHAGSLWTKDDPCRRKTGTLYSHHKTSSPRAPERLPGQP